MADEIVKKIKIDDGGSFTKIKKDIKAAKEELAGFEEGTAAFTKASKKVAELQDKMDDLNDATKNLKGSGIEKLNQSFNLLKESFTNFDPGKASLGFKVLGSAMKAIPIFLLVEGIQYLVENFDRLSKGSGFLAKALQFVGSVIDKIGEGITWLLDKFGLVNKELDKQGEAITKNAEKSKEAIAKQTTAYDQQIAITKAAGKSTVELEKAKQEAIIKTNKAIVDQILTYIKAGGEFDAEKRKIFTEANEAIRQARVQEKVNELEDTKAKKEAYQKAQDELTKLKIENESNLRAKELTQAKFDNELRVREAKGNLAILAELSIKYRQQVLDINFKYDQLEKQRLLEIQKAEEAAEKYLADLDLQIATKKEAESKNEQEQIDAALAEKLSKSLTAYSNEEAIRQAASQTSLANKIAEQEKERDLLLQNEQLTQEERNRIAAESEKKIVQMKLDSANQSISIASQGVAAFSSINELLTQSENQKLKNGEKASVELQKRQFNRQKALGITSAAINTAQGITKAIADFGPPPSPLGIAGIAAAVIAGGAQIALIASKKFTPEGSGDGATASIGAGASGGSAGQTPTPSPATLFSTGQQQQTTITPGSASFGSQPTPVIKAIVVAQDMTTQQERIAAIKDKSTI